MGCGSCGVAASLGSVYAVERPSAAEAMLNAPIAPTATTA